MCILISLQLYYILPNIFCICEILKFLIKKIYIKNSFIDQIINTSIQNNTKFDIHIKSNESMQFNDKSEIFN